MLYLLILALTILGFLLHKSKNSDKTTTPPGPRGLPFIGNLHTYDSLTPHLYFWKLSQKYGKIFSLKLGSTPMVVVSSAKLAEEVLKTHDLSFCTRPSLLGQRKLSYNGRDISFSPYSDYWREVRKISILHLFSLKKVQSFRPIREDEIFSMIKKISHQAAASQITNLSDIMISLTSALLCRVAFGIRFDDEERETRRFGYLLAEAQAMLGGIFFCDYLPYLGWIDKFTGMLARLEKNFKELDEFYEELIEKHLNPNRPKSMDGDFLDILLQLRKDQSTPIDFTLEDIKALVMIILVAGSDTSAAGVVWAMTALIKNPKCMKKVQEEIRESIGKKGWVNEEDIQNLPYFKMVIKETFRLYPAVPLLVPRESMKKSILDGYEIQPGTIVQVNQWAIGRDPEIWESPEEFKPERFLNSDIDYKGKDFELIPFGAGRRGCPGLAFGVASLELALSNLLYAFDWELPNGVKIEDIDTDVAPGITMHRKNALWLMPKSYLNIN